jgi:hypothetical protein
MAKTSSTALLTLSVDDLTVSFSTVDDLKFALDSKTHLTVSKYDELRALSLTALRKQAIEIRKVEGRLLQILEFSFSEPLAVDYQLREMDVRVFSQDYSWRPLIEALNEQGSGFAEYKRVALVKYLQYLANRQELIKRVYWNKSRKSQAGVSEDSDEAIQGFIDTSIFDGGSDLADQLKSDTAFERIPRGEPRDVRLLPGQEMTIRLSVHPFRLVRADGAYLIDEQGREYALKPRRSTVGRSSENDVVLEAAFRAISRKHLILEFPSKDRVILTDRSSHGTFVPLKHLAEG